MTYSTLKSFFNREVGVVKDLSVIEKALTFFTN